MNMNQSGFFSRMYRASKLIDCYANRFKLRRDPDGFRCQARNEVNDFRVNLLQVPPTQNAGLKPIGLLAVKAAF